jgi:hypothetical protein
MQKQLPHYRSILGGFLEKIQLLKGISFGERVAEEETNELEGYFVETDQWNRIKGGEVDVIKGEKGTGKSAIYSLLARKENELFDKGVLLVAAEKPRGTPVFKELVTDPPAGEAEFVGLWKLYILTIIAQTMKEYGISGTEADEVRKYLVDQGLLEQQFDLSRLLKAAQAYVKRILLPKSIEGSVKIDPTGAPTFSGKISLGEPSADDRAKGSISIDRLVDLANTALGKAKIQIWVLLDRLDSAFVETHELEKNALRALFRVYLDFSGHQQIKLKIFLRSDIWNRIVDSGFREASHITKVVMLEWNATSLLNLVVRRLLKNDILVKEFGIDRQAVLRDSKAQDELFYKFFPRQVDQGTRKPSTFDWMMTRCADGTGNTAPRELIHLLNSLREKEISRLELGGAATEANQLFDRSVFKAALHSVSEARLVQNLYAEYPDLRPYIEKLRGGKTEQTIESLAQLWDIPNEKAAQIIQRATEIGFFQPKGSREDQSYWVPFLYRDELEMIQGLADE